MPLCLRGWINELNGLTGYHENGSVIKARLALSVLPPPHVMPFTML